MSLNKVLDILSVPTKTVVVPFDGKELSELGNMDNENIAL